MIFLRRLPGLLYFYRTSLLFLSLLLLIVLYFLFKWNLICSNIQAWHHANKMCKLYNEGKAVGSLCRHVCSNDQFDAIKCHTFSGSKEAVFSVEWHGTRIVFKSVPTDVRTLHWYENGVLKYPTEREFLHTVKVVLKTKLNQTLGTDGGENLVRLRASHVELNSIERCTEMDNLWALIQDNEYLLATIYADKDIFPLILGTCGPYFAVEHLEPIYDVSLLLSLTDSREDWARKLRISIQILEIVEQLDTDFKDPLKLCDIKLEHFGYLPDTTKLKLMNLDGVYPRSVLQSYILSTPSCTQDTDCDIYDCRSKCASEKCTGVVSNDNLQIICEKIFLGWRLSNTVIVPGLLMSEHTPSELAAALRQCANPLSEPGKPRAVPEPEVKKRLTNILLEIEQMVNEELLN